MPPPRRRLEIFPVFVGHIARDMSVAQLRQIFERVGPVLEVTIVSDHGFVNYAEESHAVRAIQRLNGYRTGGHCLHVDFSQELADHLRAKGVRVVFTDDPVTAKRSRSPRRSRTPPKQQTRRSPSSRHIRKTSRSPRSRRSPSPTWKKSRHERMKPSERNRCESPEPGLRSPEPRHDPFTSRPNSRGNAPAERLLDDDFVDRERDKSAKGDLREFLKKRKLGSKVSIGRRIKIQVDAEAKDVERTIMLTSEEAEPLSLQELHVGNLLSRVEESDVTHLLDCFGRIHDVVMHKTHAVVAIECSPQEADDAARNLDKCTWMDNEIEVKHAGRSSLKRFKEVAASTSPAGAASPNDSRKAEAPVKKQEQRAKARTFRVHAETIPKTFLSDMKEVFARFGAVEASRFEAEGRILRIDLRSSERQAIKCIAETNKIHYKGSRLRVRFPSGTEEDSEAFQRRHIVDFHDYPTSFPSAVDSVVVHSDSSKLPEFPIGVLPSSSSLGAFGAAPTRKVLVDRASSSSKATIGPKAQPLLADPTYVAAAEGEVVSVHNKIVLVKFFTGFSHQLARLVPGQMYVNGKQCLGYLIKNNTMHTWAQDIKKFLELGSRVKLDAKRLSAREVQESEEGPCSEKVLYATPLVWKIKRPDESDLVRSRHGNGCRVFKARVQSIAGKWGTLHHEAGDVFFAVDQFFANGSLLQKEDSLIPHLMVGDLVAVQCFPADYLELAEAARATPTFSGHITDRFAFKARLVWPISAEVDPFAHHVASFDEEACRFLATSTTLSRQPPSERDAFHRACPGIIEQVQLPAGGIILLDESLGLEPQHRRVYFHRSRLFVNGAKLQSSASLDGEVQPGDVVTADISFNQDPGNPSAPPLIFSDAYWVALAVQVNTVARGAQIAKALRQEGHSDDLGPHGARGRVVHLHAPDDVAGPVRSGIAVIDSGPFSGQRIEFEASQCLAFGRSLEQADLARFVAFDEPVTIQVKPYNSFCVEAMYIGSKLAAAAACADFGAYLARHGMDALVFEQLLQAKHTPRPFLPIGGAVFHGKIAALKSTASDGAADVVVIEANIDDNLQTLEANREKVFVYGHSMAKADLSYLLDKEEVCFLYNGVLPQSDSGSAGRPQASLVWLGGEEQRPRFVGATAKLQMTAPMDSALWQLATSKGLDVAKFRALVEGRLEPKKSEVRGVGPDGNVVALDKETIEQVSLLKKLKATLGSSTNLQAVMALMAEVGSTDDKAALQNPTISEDKF